MPSVPMSVLEPTVLLSLSLFSRVILLPSIFVLLVVPSAFFLDTSTLPASTVVLSPLALVNSSLVAVDVLVLPALSLMVTFLPVILVVSPLPVVGSTEPTVTLSKSVRSLAISITISLCEPLPSAFGTSFTFT